MKKKGTRVAVCADWTQTKEMESGERGICISRPKSKMSHPSSQSAVSRLESHYIVENEDWGYERKDKLDLLRLVSFPQSIGICSFFSLLLQF